MVLADHRGALVVLLALTGLMVKDLMDQVAHHLKLLKDRLDQEVLLDPLMVLQGLVVSVPQLTLPPSRRC